MKKILVTGAGGLVGKGILDALNERKDWQIYQTFHNVEFGVENNENTILIDLEKDTFDCESVKFDCIVHCAARIPTDKFSDHQVSIINRKIDDNIINYCVTNNCKIIYISGTAVYGFNNPDLLDESTPIDIKSNYILEKWHTEQSIQKKCSHFVILRISSPYGYGQKNNNVMKTFLDNAGCGRDIVYWGNGGRTQNFINKKDIGEAVVAALHYEKNDIFNIASKEAISMKDLAYLIKDENKRLFNIDLNVVCRNIVDEQEDVRININIQKAKNELNWEPQIPLVRGIEEWLRLIRREHCESI